MTRILYSLSFCSQSETFDSSSRFKVFTPSLTVSIILLITMTLGCGTQPEQSKNNNQDMTSTHQHRGQETPFNPITDLLTQVESGLKNIQEESTEAIAAVRFLILHPHALKTDEETKAKLTSFHFKKVSERLAKSNVNSLIRSKLMNRFTVTSASRTDDLPINLEVFTSEAKRRKIDLNDFQGLIFVSYHGQALNQGLQLQVNCAITQMIADSPLLDSHGGSTMIASLSTFELFERSDFMAKCSTLQESWVKPVAELVEDRVRLISRGMNQWGRPELELGPISKHKASQLFSVFMKVVDYIRTTPLSKKDLFKIQGKQIKLSDCLRPSHHYDLSCRQMSLSSQLSSH